MSALGCSIFLWGHGDSYLNCCPMCCLEEKHKGELRRMQDSTESSRGSNPSSHSPLDSGKCSCLRKISAQGGRRAEPEFSVVPEAFLLRGRTRSEKMEEFSVLLHKRCTPWKGLLLTGKDTHSLSLWGGQLRGRSESHEEKRILRGDPCFWTPLWCRR